MKNILVVAHDAGEANIFSCLIKKYAHDFHWFTYTSGPAKKIFIKEKTIFKTTPLKMETNQLNKVISSLNLDLILTGTGGGSDSKMLFIRAGKKNHIKTASFLDHWCHYRERFGYPGKWKENLPDFVFVGDKWAYKTTLKLGFPKSKLLYIKNPYFQEIIKKSTKKGGELTEKSHLKKILYLSEPLPKPSIDGYRNFYNGESLEYKVVRILLEIIKLPESEQKFILMIRFHPAENINKYTQLLKDKKYDKIRRFVKISNPASSPLEKDCLWSDIVISSTSMALFIAFVMGKSVISYLPEKNYAFSLPQKEIKKVHSQKELMQALRTSGKNNSKAKYLLSEGLSFTEFFHP
ncbi:hypothetical protein A2160_02560 [Candidatus Beckwithbacteria bacterium RBG_13_42_9]|uniref:UDP-N-acetylglucosamine 2-epimerase domain-containing protein n=1 Tax=Candidatus Beckwithbacteria bacterium RBG_13_42_9 TaxID=1797457 RepID=A0A1F5E7J2_9BACT|nr:MAG: hypothetical protein A2160_02560 [Candidatus Beckwithbacteria bacterium RBG_13_42_9]